MTPETRASLIEHLGQFVTENKRGKIDTVVASRTRHLALVLEDIMKPQNASATIRTADCMGIQDAYVIEKISEYEINPEVALGASKWVDLHKFGKTEACFAHLRQQGYKIVATSLAADTMSPATLPLGQKLAIVFGNEELGISEYAAKNADILMKIPMYGFTQSFNISVSVAITLNHLVHRLHHSDLDWRLSESEREALILQWYRKVVDRSEIIERNFLGS